SSTHPDGHVGATGPAGKQLTYKGPTATDSADGLVPVFCNPPPGSTFPLGHTIVDCKAMDSHGNFADSFFDVFVEDLTAPVVKTRANVVVEARRPAGSAVSYTPPTARDRVDGPLPASCSPAPRATFPGGHATG